MTGRPHGDSRSGPGLGWGIVGTGRMAREVAGDVGSTGGTVVAVVSRSPTRGVRFASQFGGATSYRDLADLLVDPAVDVVYLGNPNALHSAQVIECAKARRHVLCDKPIGLTAREGERARDAAAKAGVQLGTMFQGHHHPAARRTRDAIAAGRIGTIEVVRVSVGFGVEELTGWRASRRLAGGGAVFNLGLHAYDMVRFLTGSEVTEVTALMDPSSGSGLDRTALALLRLRSGAMAFVHVSQAFSLDDVSIEIRGTTGWIAWTGWMAPYRTGSLTIREGGITERHRSSCPDAYARVVQDFVRSIHAMQPPDPSPTDAVEAVRIADAVISSARTGRRIRLRANQA